MKQFRNLLVLTLLMVQFLFARGMIVGYIPDYRSEPTTEQLNKITHVIPFSLQVSSSGDLQTQSIPSWLSSDFVSKAHAADTKVQICVGGWGRSGGFSGAVTSGKANFISNLVSFVDQYNLDGVDIDWEFPGAYEMDAFGTFLAELKAALGEDKQLSIAVGASHSPSEFPASVFSAVDAVHLMAYDMQNQWPGHSDYSKSMELINSWWNYGKSVTADFKKDKLVLGVPFYTRGAGVIGFAQVFANGGESAVNLDSWSGYSYNGIATIERKTEECFSAEYGGIMIWEIFQDLAPDHEFSLLNAIHTKTEELGGYSEGKSYSIEASAGIGGTIEPSGTVRVDSAKSRTFTFTPNRWFIVDDVIINGNSEGPFAEYTFTDVTAESTIEVLFKKDPNAPDLNIITTKAESNGTISPDGSNSVESGSDNSVSITADEGYVVDYVKIDGVVRGPLASVDFKSVTQDHTVEAFFKEGSGGDLGNYDLWEAKHYMGGVVVAHEGRLWRSKWQVQASDYPGITDVSYTPGWEDIGEYNTTPDTLVTADLNYRSAADGTDTLIIKTDSVSQGTVYSTLTDTVILQKTSLISPKAVSYKGGIVINRQDLSFTAPESSPAKVELFDLRGRVVFEREIRTLTGAASHTGINPLSFSRGIYIMRIRQGSKSAVARLNL